MKLEGKAIYVYVCIGTISHVFFLFLRSSEEEILIARQLEKAIRRSGAIDLESLCILASSKVYILL